ncbi:LysR family transcriptional regulator [Pseudomonas luteola]|uniref:LysR family transcriptional regulator n=1 Tax=Pseudomonas luteola TaxID=47886 RepID=UPI003A86093B
MGQIDLNLIRTFVTLYDSGSVTVAAERLFVTQPSVSYALARLRELFDDPLFVRNRDGMQPTSVARTLYATFKDALSRIEGTVEGIREFDPHKTARCFRIALSDLGEMALLPLILHRLNRLAPQAELEVVPLEIDQVNEWLSIGKVDAAICSRPLSSTGIVRQALIDERYVCLLSRKHSRIKRELTLDQFQRESHVLVTRASGHGMAEDVIERLGISRRIALRIPHFSVLPKIIPQTDLLVILPSQIATLFAAEHPLRICNLPFDVPSFKVTLHWHERSNTSVALRWFLGLVAEAITQSRP